MRELLWRLARENPGWDYLRIVGELRKLGVTVSATSVRAILAAAGVPPAPQRDRQSGRSFLRAGLPCYDPSTPGARYDISKAKAELAKSKFPHGFKLEMTVASGDQVHQAIGQILQNALKSIGIDLTFKQVDSSTEYANIQQLKYQVGVSYWQNDNIDPRRARHLRPRPTRRRPLVVHRLQRPKGDRSRPQSPHETKPAARCRLYAKMQDLAAQDAFAGFIYYSPFAYAYSDKVHRFFVSPLGNFHLEDVWLG